MRIGGSKWNREAAAFTKLFRWAGVLPLPVDVSQVRTLISQRGIRGQQKGRPAVLTSLAPGQWSVPGLSAELGMPTASIYNWIYRGWITARHAPGTRNWIITADDEQMQQLRERRARPPGFYARARWAPQEQEQEPGEKQGTQP